MYVIYGLVWGVGFSFVFVLLIVVFGQYFDRKLVLVNGIVILGSGVGSFVVGLVINYLLEIVGWKNFMRILSVIVLVLWIVVLFFKLRESYQDIMERKMNFKLFDILIWRNKVYVLWVFIVVLFQFGYFVLFVYLVSYVFINCFILLEGIQRLFDIM